MRKCGRCQADTDGEEHHLIPKKLWDNFNITGNVDLYRVVLCDKCHFLVTTKWVEINKKIDMMLSLQENRPMDKMDDSVEKILGENSKDYYLLLGGHKVIHLPMKCPICKKPQKKDWIKKKIEAGADEGYRNISRFLLALNMKRAGMKDETIFENILKFNKNCRPPESERDVKNHFISIRRRWKYYGL